MQKRHVGAATSFPVLHFAFCIDVVRPLILAVAVLLAALYVAPLVWPVALMDPDEGLHAAISQEMLSRGDFLVPRFLGEPFLDKPILFFWSQCASMRLFGENEAAVRLPGLVFGALGAITTGWLAATILGGVGWWAALAYTTMLIPIALMEVPVHDIALVPFVNVALLGFWRASRAPATSGVLRWSLVSGLALGAAMLAKGLTGVAIVGLAHAAVLLLERRLSVAIVAGGLLALFVGVAIAVPWYLAMEHASPGYLHYYLVERHLGGFSSESQRHAYRPWTYYIPVIAGGGLPWALYVPLSFRREIGSPAAAPAAVLDARRLGVAWLLTGLVFLSAAGSKLFTYALPLFPAVALLAVIGWSRALHSASGRRWLGRLVVMHGVVFSLFLPATIIGLSAGVLEEPVRPAAWLWLPAIAIAAGCGAAVWLWRRGRLGATGGAAALVTAVFILSAWLGVMPSIAQTLTAKDLARVLNGRSTFPPALWVVRDRLGSIVFYLSPRLRAGLTRDRLRLVTPRDVRILRAPAGTLVAIDDDTQKRMSSFVVLDGVPYERAGQYRLYAAEALGNVVK